MATRKKKEISMLELTAGYEDFIKSKKTNKKGKKLFAKTLKKAIKQRGSK